MSQEKQDERFMRIALELAKRGLGNSFPNPAVGCLVVKNNEIKGRGWTAPGGRPHAETIALEHAGKDAENATVYVTLEPCCHHGKTPPCTDALIKAGIKRVVIATGDPDQKVSGKGIIALKKAGIEISTGICKKAADEINAGFFSKILKNRPLITLKIATTSDGKITMEPEKKSWFTGDKAKDFVHFLRMKNDAIMVGVGTILADNPKLTCRLPGLEKYSPIRIIMDSNLRTPETAEIIKTSDTTPTWIFTNKKDKLGKAEIIEMQNKENGMINLKNALEKLAEKGITRLLVEGGTEIVKSFLSSGFVDKLIWISSDQAKGAKKAPDISILIKNYASRMHKEEEFFLGNDKVLIFSAKTT